MILDTDKPQDYGDKIHQQKLVTRQTTIECRIKN